MQRRPHFLRREQSGGPAPTQNSRLRRTNPPPAPSVAESTSSPPSAPTNPAPTNPAPTDPAPTAPSMLEDTSHPVQVILKIPDFASPAAGLRASTATPSARHDESLVSPSDSGLAPLANVATTQPSGRVAPPTVAARVHPPTAVAQIAQVPNFRSRTATTPTQKATPQTASPVATPVTPVAAPVPTPVAASAAASAATPVPAPVPAPVSAPAAAPEVAPLTNPASASGPGSSKRFLERLPEWQRLALQAAVMIAAAVLVVMSFAWWHAASDVAEEKPRRPHRGEATAPPEDAPQDDARQDDGSGDKRAVLASKPSSRGGRAVEQAPDASASELPNDEESPSANSTRGSMPVVEETRGEGNSSTTDSDQPQLTPADYPRSSPDRFQYRSGESEASPEATTESGTDSRSSLRPSPRPSTSTFYVDGSVRPTSAETPRLGNIAPLGPGNLR